jgi:hypothetical protein
VLLFSRRKGNGKRERERAGTNIREKKKNNTEGAAIGKSEKKKKKEVVE